MKRVSLNRCKRSILILSLALLLLIPAFSCNDDTPTGTNDEQPTGSLVSATGCLLAQGARATSFPLPTQDCIEYRYDGAGTLDITHLNAGFNCCPGKITADIDIENHIITIIEHEAEHACRCLCLYNVDYTIEHLPPGEYEIRVVELYRIESDEPLEFTIDLSLEPNGFYCVDRTHGPWYSESTPGSSAGTLLDIVGCKTYSGIPLGSGTFAAPGPTPSDKDCLEYTYMADGRLFLTHVNAGFNCCPTIDVSFNVSADSITVTEIELQGLCYCLCLFNMYYRIDDLAPGVYTVTIINPYVQEGDEMLQCTIDLAQNPTGKHCVTRTYYPWGQ